MKLKAKRNIWLVIGAILTLGPMWGQIGSAIGMFLAFDTLGTGSPEVGLLAQHVSIALYATVAGIVMCPIGITIIVIAAVKMGGPPEYQVD